MNLLQLFMVAIALSLDSFSISITCGIKLPKNCFRKFLKISFFFGLFQALMPLAGYLLAATFFKSYVTNYAHWIAFIVFLSLSIKTFADYFKNNNNGNLTPCDCKNYRCLISLSIATSVDAFIVGTIIGIQNQSLTIPIILIGVVTFINSMLGCLLGNYSLSWFKNKARLLAAFILFALAASALFE